MNISEARVSANRLNALKSTGPRTTEGKERSRANAYKHGMAGTGVVVAVEDQVEMGRRVEALEAEFPPGSDLDRSLVQRVAWLSLRLERSATNESAATSARVLTAEDDFDEDRVIEVDRLMDSLEDDPAGSVRRLGRTPEGIDRMVAAWLAIGADVACSAEDRWTADHRRMVENLSGRKPGGMGISRPEALARAIGGDFTLLAPGDGSGLDDLARAAWARRMLVALIDAEVAGLTARREAIDLERIDHLRALAPAIALFDPSRPAQLARRYEAETERGMYRGLKELKERSRSDAAPAREVRPAPPTPSPEEMVRAGALASFRAIDATGLLAAPVTPRPRPDLPKTRPSPPSRRDRTSSCPPRDVSSIVVGRG